MKLSDGGLPLSPLQARRCCKGRLGWRDRDGCAAGAPRWVARMMASEALCRIAGNDKAPAQQVDSCVVAGHEWGDRSLIMLRSVVRLQLAPRVADQHFLLGPFGGRVGPGRGFRRDCAAMNRGETAANHL